jgi:hypothetical protein
MPGDDAFATRMRLPHGGQGRCSNPHAAYHPRMSSTFSYHELPNGLRVVCEAQSVSPNGNPPAGHTVASDPMGRYVTGDQYSGARLLQRLVRPATCPRSRRTRAPAVGAAVPARRVDARERRGRQAARERLVAAGAGGA